MTRRSLSMTDMKQVKDIVWPEALFVTGTGTDVGKSWATGWLAREIACTGRKTITQKLVQTGNHEYSEDIDVHRKVMGIPMQPVDTDHTTAPIIFSYPASPHLAARIDGKKLELETADKSTELLKSIYDTVLIEGAGGLMVPLHEDYLTAEYIRDRKLPAIFVVNGRLGSINEALMTLLTARHYGLNIFAVVYNPHFDTDKTIAAETRAYLQKYVADNYPESHFILMDEI